MWRAGSEPSSKRTKASPRRPQRRSRAPAEKDEGELPAKAAPLVRPKEKNYFLSSFLGSSFFSSFLVSSFLAVAFVLFLWVVFFSSFSAFWGWSFWGGGAGVVGAGAGAKPAPVANPTVSSGASFFIRFTLL